MEEKSHSFKPRPSTSNIGLCRGIRTSKVRSGKRSARALPSADRGFARAHLATGEQPVDPLSHEPSRFLSHKHLCCPPHPPVKASFPAQQRIYDESDL